MKGSSKRSSGKKPARMSSHKRVSKLRKGSVKHAVKSGRSDDQYMKFSGKFTVRLPKSLHQALVDRAEREGVSLNLFVTNALSRTVAAPKR